MGGQKEKNRHTADICHSEDIEVKLTGVWGQRSPEVRETCRQTQRARETDDNATTC